MAVSTVGYSSATPSRLVLDAGAIYKNVTYATGDFTGTLIGATSGGNEFVFKQTLRQVEIDGAKGPVKGLEIIEKEEAELNVNLKELTAQNVALSIAGSNTVTTDVNYDVITSKGKVDLTDYIDSIAYVGRVSGTNKPVVIILKNVLSLEGLNFKTEDNKEVVIPIKFAAHADEADVQAGTLPVLIYWPKEVA
jgi:phage FluMu protein gp41